MTLPKSITLTFPDESKHLFPAGVTAMEVTQSIGEWLKRSALAAIINGEAYDLSTPIDNDASFEVITSQSEKGLEIIRHDAAHILAQAVKHLFPDVQVTIGPVIDNGFYYDFAKETPFSSQDLDLIEQEMAAIIARDEPIKREEWDRDEAIAFFQSIGEQYKAEIIASIPGQEIISLYRQGDFIDLCRGPHSPNTGKVGAFKLMKVAGAYWRGDSNNIMLQRIYGTAWPDKKQLRIYLNRLEEAEKRDHRKIAKAMHLFHIQDEAVGQIFWHPPGWVLYQALQQYIRRKLVDSDYQEVRTPMLVDRHLWERSGHWDKFREQMFTLESESKILAIKPMSCPGHLQIFNQGVKSYRDLPLRLSEFGHCHRDEPSGALHGLMRVRGFTQDDGHIFCTEAQITEETIVFCELLLSIYKDLGFSDVKVKFSDRPAKRAGSDEVWDKAESSLKEAVEAAGLTYSVNPGEGAFYGPKLEFVLVDAIGRNWQCGTLQVDFVLPERLDAHFVDSDGKKKRPVILHRAILGSFERFLGILIEEYAGRFPLWLAPIQLCVATITNEVDNYAKEVHAAFKKAGIRAILDSENDKINFKVRHHSHQKTPIIIVVGEKESQQRAVSVRRLGGKEQVHMPLDEAVKKISLESKPPA